MVIVVTGVEEKSFGKAANVDNDTSNLCGSPGFVSQNHLEASSFNLEKLDCNSITNLGPSIVELLQSDVPNAVGSNFMRSSAMNKLLVWKGEISKTLEVTESEIDSLENELRSLNSETGGSGLCPATSSSLPLEENAKSCTQQDVVTNLIPRPAPLQIISSGNRDLDEMPICSGQPEEVCGDAKDEDVDSPGTVTSKFVEPLCLVKALSSSDMLDDGIRDSQPVQLTGDSETVQLTNSEVKFLVPGSEGERMIIDYGDGSSHAETEKDAPVSGDLYTDGEEKLCDAILASNKESSSRAFEEFNKLLPKLDYKFDISGVGKSLSCQNDLLIKERFAIRKRFSMFKERVITLKFKVFQHLWKEDLRALSMKKYRAKSQKKFELSLRSMHSGHQKNRSSIRSRISSPGKTFIFSSC